MGALTQSRKTLKYGATTVPNNSTVQGIGVAASTILYEGGIICKNSSG